MVLKLDEGVVSDLKIVTKIERESYHPKGTGMMILAECKCGSLIERPYSYVKRGRVRSCKPCASIQHSKDIIKICDDKGRGNKRIMSIWSNMKTRCYNKKETGSYKYHGAKGVTVCEEWLHDRRTFEEWALSNGYDDRLTLDRFDNNDNYSPDNCRWTTRKNQTLNSRRRSDNTTGERCVSPLRGKFQLNIDGKYCGVYATVEQAVNARDSIINNDRIL